MVLACTSYASIYFNVILVALILLLLDAIREISKYSSRIHASNDPANGSLHYGPTMELVREFRAQRNFYISGTALFLWFVIKRLLALISYAAHLIAQNQAYKSQAESASRAATALIDARGTERPAGAAAAAKSPSAPPAPDTEFAERLKVKEGEIDALQRSYRTAKNDMDSMKKQSESVAREYDNLLKDHAKLQAKLEKYESGGGEQSKKAN